MAWRSSGEIAAWVFGIPAGLGLLVLVGLLWAVRTGNAEPHSFEKIVDTSSDVLGQIGSYLAVAVLDPSASASEAGLAVAVFGLIFLIHISVGLVHVSPLFYLLGYRVYSGTTDRGSTYYLIVRSDVADWSGTRLLVGMAGGVLVEKREHAT